MMSRPSGDNGTAAGGMQQEVASVDSNDTMEYTDMGNHDNHTTTMPQSPSMREQGNNKTHLQAHLCDHTYANPTSPGIISTGHKVFFNSPESPDVEEGDVIQAHQQVCSEISMDYVVYGTVTALKNLLDYIDSLVTHHRTQIAQLNCKEGVILSRSLSVGAPGIYENGRQFDILCKLGTGTFGSVFSCKDRATGAEFAYKKVRMSSFRRQEVEVVIELTDQSVGARCLPQVYGLLLDGDFVCILMEYVDTSWHECLKEHSKARQLVGEETVVNLLRQSLHGLRHLQLHRVSHCDIKPENMGYNRHGEVKFLDFGTVRLSAEEFSHRGMTLNYMAPEVCERQSHFNSDMWALGCTIIYLTVQKHPWFKVAEGKELLIRIQNKPEDILQYVTHAEKELRYSPQLADLLRRMLDADPDRRITAEDALRHSLFQVKRPTSGTLSSLGAVGEDVPTVVPLRASNSEVAPGQSVQSFQQLGIQNQTTQVAQYHHDQGQRVQGQLYQGQVAQGQPYQGQVVLDQAYQDQIARDHRYQGQIVQGHAIQGPLAQGHRNQGQMDQGQAYHFQIAQGHGDAGRGQPILRKVSQVHLANLGTSYHMAGDYAKFRRGPPGNGSYPVGRGEGSESVLRGRNTEGNRLPDELDGQEGMDVTDEQVAERTEKACNQTSGYHTGTNNVVSIEVCYMDKVDEFRINRQQTIGEIWPQLKDTASKLMGNTVAGAVAIYEGNKKVDTTTFSEEIERPRKFCLRVLTE